MYELGLVLSSALLRSQSYEDACNQTPVSKHQRMTLQNACCLAVNKTSMVDHQPFCRLYMPQTNFQSLKTHALELCAHVPNSNMPIAMHVRAALCLSLCKCKFAIINIDNLLHANKAFSVWMYSPEAEHQHCLSR